MMESSMENNAQSQTNNWTLLSVRGGFYQSSPPPQPTYVPQPCPLPTPPTPDASTYSCLNYTPHHYPSVYPQSFSPHNYWYPPSPQHADVATSGYQPHQQYHPHHHPYSWHQEIIQGSTSSTRTRRCVKCTCPNCHAEEITGVKKAKKMHNCHYPDCTREYGKTSHLQAHLRSHTGEKPFECYWLFCGKRFTRSDELQRHLRTHTGDKNYVCQICSKRFMRSDHLAKHVKTHDNKKASKTVSERSTKGINEAVPYFHSQPNSTMYPVYREAY